MAVSVVACDSDSDAAVVNPQAAPAATTTTTARPSVTAPDGPQEHLTSQLAELQDSDLSAATEIADLMLMREEEKLARDVYVPL
jgi:hypothetical protein